MVKTVLFDVDGVLLSEERYFDASALTVWEVFNSSNYLGLSPKQFKTEYTNDEIEEIRNLVFEDDQILKFLKARGLNANWDMIYLTVAHQLILLLVQVKETHLEQIHSWVCHDIDRKVLQEIGALLAGQSVQLQFEQFRQDFKEAEGTKQGLFAHLDELAKKKLGVRGGILGRKGTFWDTCELISQEWYVGDKHVFDSTGRHSVQTGKKGFLSDEKVLAQPQEIAGLFKSLSNRGVRIGIGTGRPHLETIEPFKYLDWLKYFEIEDIVTADDVLAAERAMKSGVPLSKPHPYTYILALSGKKKSVEQCLQEPLPLQNGSETVIVGDSMADLLAARKMGCTFVAVLTGLSGQAAREEFELHGVEYIIDHVLDLKDLIDTLN